MRALRLGALTLLLSSCLSASLASADEGAAALLPFQGYQANKVRQRVHNGLRDRDVQLIPLKRVNAVVKKTKGYAKQAAALKATVLVRSRVRRVQGKWIADTELRNAKGQRIKKLRVTAPSFGRLPGRIVGQLMKTGRMPVTEKAAAAEPEPTPPEPTQPRVVLRPFTGAQASKIRAAVLRGLRSEPVEFYPNKKFVQKAQSMGVNLKADGGHVEPARALSVSGLIEGDVLREDGVWSAYVRLIDGESAAVISQHFYDAGTLSALIKSVQASVGSDFHEDLEKLGAEEPVPLEAAPVVAVTAAPIEDVVKKDEAEIQYKARRTKDKGPKKDRPAAVDIELDFRLVHRNFEYRDDLRGDLRPYTLKLGPGVGTKFQYYPGAHFTAGVGAQFGIDFEWERLFKFDSTRPDGAKFPTESQQFLIGLRWRYPIKRWEPSLVVDYGVHTFGFGVSGPPVPGEDNTPGIPSVKYQFVRVGAGFRVGVGKKESFIIATNLAFRGVFSVGSIGTTQWFPEAKANGMDAMLMFGYALPKGFEVRLGGDYRRYWFDLNPVPPDPPYVAGGALDQYWGISIGAAWRW